MEKIKYSHDINKAFEQLYKITNEQDKKENKARRAARYERQGISSEFLEKTELLSFLKWRVSIHDNGYIVQADLKDFSYGDIRNSFVIDAPEFCLSFNYAVDVYNHYYFQVNFKVSDLKNLKVIANKYKLTLQPDSVIKEKIAYGKNLAEFFDLVKLNESKQT